jgi:hypothetical protein
MHELEHDADILDAVIERYFWWINERHRIYLARLDNKPWPWTKDEVLQNYKFTNVFRELDTGTIWLRENWRNPYADHGELFFNICVYRVFNWWATAEVIGYQEEWDPEGTEAKLRELRKNDIRIFTNAHMMTATLGGDRITQTVWKILDPLWSLVVDVEPVQGDTLQSAFTRLLKHPDIKGIGPFLSYEIVTDCRHTRYLGNADDIMTWANPGPGAMRGINRIHGKPIGWNEDKTYFHSRRQFPPDYYVEFMQYLLEISPGYLEDHVPSLEMRDIEHCLCEFDKYERATKGEGRPRLKFVPPHLRSV